MHYLPFVVVFLAIFALFSAGVGVAGSRGATERATSLRLAVFGWLLGIIMVVALFLVPNKLQVLMFAPVLLGAVALAKVWRGARLRARRQDQSQVDLERMKRVR